MDAFGPSDYVPGQGRLGDKARAPIDAHGCPACPHPSIGPAICGSADVTVNGRPALRVGDPGIHAACCGRNTWTAQAGSATVFVNNKPAHRKDDMTTHCGGSGQLAEGSSNVIVGGDTTGGTPGHALGAPTPALGGLRLPDVVLPGAPLSLRLGPVWLPPFITGVSAVVTWTVDGVSFDAPGDITIELGPEHAGRHVPISARLGDRVVTTRVAVPRLAVEGPDTVEIDEEIRLHAHVTPQVAGRYRWFDAAGALVGEGSELRFVGKNKSMRKGDQPVECRFTADGGGHVLSAQHPITVVEVPRLRLPIKVSLRDRAETMRWLRDNPVEVVVDGAVVGSHAIVEGAGKIVVSFRVPPGEHAIMISSGASSWAAGRPPIRLVHFSAKVTVTATS